jgi:uncharacterized protein (TIGR03437 family)
MKIAIVILVVAAWSSIALAQECPVTTDVATYPAQPLTYPMTSNRYAVEYQLGGAGAFTNAQVYESYYGGTTSSPYIKASQYPADTSMSFVSIPAAVNTGVAIRVTKLFGSPPLNNNFPATVTVRPTAKGIHVDSVSGATVQLSTKTAADFAGEQFVLWWDGDAQQSSAIQGLAFFLNPPYTRPTGSNVKTITGPADLTGDLSHFDTLDFEGTVAVGSTGAQAFIVPANIDNIFLGPAAWVQGKLRFTQSGSGNLRQTYGPGVLDVSRFNYMYRQCRNSTIHTDDGYQAISSIPLTAGATGSTPAADEFVFDGLIVTDSDYYNTDGLSNTTVNNVKLISWNGNNDGFQFGTTAHASNIFVRTGDDSLKMWGAYITVTNAMVWQNWNGGVINLGWADNSPGDDSLIDGVYVVKTDWHAPTAPSWTTTDLNGSNDAIVASLMVPGTNFGTLLPSVYRNIYVEDAPRVLFSLKILPPDCSLKGLTTCPVLDPTLLGILNLNLENIYTPASIVQNSIGFQNVDGTNLIGSMNLNFTNVMLTLPNGTVTPLTSANAATTGNIGTNGDNISITYASVPKATAPPLVSSGAVINGASFAVGAPVGPGSIASVFGSGFGSSPAGVTVVMGGIVAPLFVVTPQQINFQVPWQLFGQTQAPLTVTSGSLTSAPVMVPLANVAPGIFMLNAASQAAALVANTASIAASVGAFPGSRPAQRGEFLSIYCTGLGPVTHAPATGALASASPVSLTSGTMTASIGGVPATVSFSGLAPGFLGLYQVNVQVPSNAPTGSAVPLIISVGSKTSNQVTVAVAASQ